MRNYFLIVMFMASITCVQAQKVRMQLVKGLKFNIPPINPLPESYKTYQVELQIDSVLSYFTGKPFDKNHDQDLKKRATKQAIAPGYKLVDQGGDFRVVVAAGTFVINKVEIVAKPKYTDNTVDGFVKLINYSLPVKMIVYNKEGTVINDMTLVDRNETTTFQYNPNFDLLFQGENWNKDLVFETVDEMESRFKDQSKVVFDHLIIQVLGNAVNVRAVRKLESLYTGFPKVDYAPRFYIGKVKESNSARFNYTDLDSAYASYSRAFAKFNLNLANRENYKGDFEKALNVCLSALDENTVRMTDELKNGLLYNVAAIYYHTGRPAEGKKYFDRFKVSDFDVVREQNPYFESKYKGKDIHFVLFETYWSMSK